MDATTAAVDCENSTMTHGTPPPTSGRSPGGIKYASPAVSVALSVSY